MRRKLVGVWVALLALAVVPAAAGAEATAGGLTSVVCVNLAVLMALTITPVETLVDAFRGFLPQRQTQNE